MEGSEGGKNKCVSFSHNGVVGCTRRCARLLVKGIILFVGSQYIYQRNLLAIVRGWKIFHYLLSSSFLRCCFGSGRVNTVNETSLRNRRRQEKEMKRLWVEKLEQLFTVAWESLVGFLFGCCFVLF